MPQDPRYRNLDFLIELPYEPASFDLQAAPVWTDLDQEIKELRLDLAQELLAVAKRSLTPRQFSVFWGFFVEERTQSDLAKSFGIGQPAVHKALWGNKDYKRNKTYGGAVWRLKEAVKRSRKIPALRARLLELEALL